MASPVFLRKVVLHNYKSIAKCAVALGPVNFLVGQNGAGKSNFLDALRLVSDSLQTTLDHALRDRGGINEVRRRSSGHPTAFGIRLEFSIGSEYSGSYAFQVGARANGAYEVTTEECRIQPAIGGAEAFYLVREGLVEKTSGEIMPPAAADRLYLVAAAGLPEFRPLYDALSSMGFYNLNPDAIREPQAPDPGDMLKRDGRNLAAVLDQLKKNKVESFEAVVEYLSKIVPGITTVESVPISRKMSLEFRQYVGTAAAPWRFISENMSDGTLRALGTLAALFQAGGAGRKAARLVGIEEPETAIHPGAAGILRAAILAASATTQIIVTSHSPDLLDDDEIDPSWILAVENKAGETSIGPIDECGITTLKDRLYTAGELLKLGQLMPDNDALASITPRQYELFGEVGA